MATTGSRFNNSNQTVGVFLIFNMNLLFGTAFHSICGFFMLYYLPYPYLRMFGDLSVSLFPARVQATLPL
jgi:hypothetical protein